jgi:hypothetical protein
MATVKVIFLLLGTTSLVQAIGTEFVFLISTEAPGTKLFPEMLRDFVDPRFTELGLTLLTVGAGKLVMVKVLPFEIPRSGSDTVMVAVPLLAISPAEMAA